MLSFVLKYNVSNQIDIHMILCSFFRLMLLLKSQTMSDYSTF